MHARVRKGAILFDRFRLDGKLGEGGMGEVWCAHDRLMEQRVALKFVSAEYLGDPRALLLLKREAQKARILTHPNIVRVHDFHEEPGLAFISMEYVEGKTFQSMQRREPGQVFEPGAIRDLVAQLCEALHYAHTTAGMIHRDLKPANLMVDARRQLRVMDFGIAAPQPATASSFTRSLASSGTLPYMSPQQLKGEAPSPKDDLYSLGATLYELFTGAPPFYTNDIAHDILCTVPPSVRQRREDFGLDLPPIAPVWESVIAQCLAKDPTRRPQSAREIVTRLSIHRTMPVALAPAQDRVACQNAGFAVPLDQGPRLEGKSETQAEGQTMVGSAIRSWSTLGLVALVALGSWLWSRRGEPVSAKGDRPEVAMPVASASSAASVSSTPDQRPAARVDSAPPEQALPVHLELPLSIDEIYADAGSELVLVDRGVGRIMLVTPAPEVSVRVVELARAPAHVSFSPGARRLYCAYGDGRLTSVSTEPGGHLQELEFARHPASPVNILAIDYGLLVADKVGAWGSLTSYPESGGRMAASREYFAAPRYSVWHGGTRRAIFLSYEHSPRDIAYEEISSTLALGNKGDSPYHNSAGMDGPIYALDRFIGLGSGRIYDPNTLTLVATLPFEVRAGTAVGGSIFVADRSATGVHPQGAGGAAPTRVHRVGERGEDQASVQIPGRFIGMCPWAGTLAVAADAGGRTRLFFLDENLNFAEPPPPRADEVAKKPVIIIKRSAAAQP